MTGTGFTVAVGFSILTVLLLSFLTVTWTARYREYRTPLMLGLVLFCVVLLAENLAAVVFYFSSQELFYVDDPAIELVTAVKRGLQFLAVLVFTYVTVR